MTNNNPAPADAERLREIVSHRMAMYSDARKQADLSTMKTQLNAIMQLIATEKKASERALKRRIKKQYGCPGCGNPNQRYHESCWKEAMAGLTSQEKMNNGTV